VGKLFANEGDQYKEYDQDVGHILCKSHNLPYTCTSPAIADWVSHSQSEEQGFSQFHLYVCAAFLVKWSDQLVKMNFQEVLMFLQALPTKDWTEKDIELLLSEAFIWQSLFRGSSAHLRNSGGAPSMGSLGPSQ
jgi:hypothetical protein